MKLTLKPRFPTRRQTLLSLALLLAVYGAAKVFLRHDAHAAWMLVVAGVMAGATLLFGRFYEGLRKKWVEPDKRSELKL
jgi:hypothetical protein